MKTVGVNRASVRIRPSGKAGDYGRDTFTKQTNKQTNKQMKKKKELNKHPRTDSDLPIGSNRKGVLVCFFPYRLKTPQIHIVTRASHFSCIHVILDKLA